MLMNITQKPQWWALFNQQINKDDHRGSEAPSSSGIVLNPLRENLYLLSGKDYL